MAVVSLNDYYQTVALGIIAYFNKEKSIHGPTTEGYEDKKKKVGAIVFGSDIGLVGQFNDRLADFVIQSLLDIQGPKRFG